MAQSDQIAEQTNGAASQVIKTEVQAVKGPEVENTTEAHVKYMKDKRMELKQVLIESKRTKGFPNATSEQTNKLRAMHQFLEWLDMNVEMTPDIKRQTEIETFLTVSDIVMVLFVHRNPKHVLIRCRP